MIRFSRPPAKSEIESLEARIRAFAASPELVNENLGMLAVHFGYTPAPTKKHLEQVVQAIAINSILRYLNLPEK